MCPVMAIHKQNLTTPASLGGDFQNNKLTVWHSSEFSQGNLFPITSIFTSKWVRLNPSNPPPPPPPSPSHMPKYTVSVPHVIRSHVQVPMLKGTMNF